MAPPAKPSESITSASSKAAKSFCKQGFCSIPTRYIVIALSALANCLSYTLRTSFNLTIVAMVKTSKNKTEYETCIEPNDTSVYNNQNQIHGDYEWSDSLQGIVLGAYYYGYILTSANAGQLADWIGSRWLIGMSVLISGLVTALIPIGAEVSVYFVIVLRTITGLVQGVITPALYTMLAYWVPQQERSLALAMIQIGGNIGAVVTLPISAFLCEQTFGGGWPLVFYIFGAGSSLCFIPWMYSIYNTPAQHPRIDIMELSYINANVTASKGKKKNVWVPWREILKSGQVWTVAVTKFCSAWGYFFIMSKLPAYLHSILHMSMNKNGLINALVYIANSASLMFFGFFSDFIERKKLMRRTVSRKVFQNVAMIGAAATMSLVAVFNCDQLSVIILLISSMVILGIIAGGDVPIVVDIAPDYSGSVYGFTNSIASTPGFLAPLFVGLILDSTHMSPMKEWHIMFFFASAIYLFGALVFVAFISSKPTKWGNARQGTIRSTIDEETGSMAGSIIRRFQEVRTSPSLSDNPNVSNR